MAKNKVLTEKTDINTPFSEFVRKFKKQKTAMVAMVFLVFLVAVSYTHLDVYKRQLWNHSKTEGKWIGGFRFDRF